MSWDAKDADEKFKDLSARGINAKKAALLLFVFLACAVSLCGLCVK
ncbi:MAG: hypothetical protein LW832_04150 [Parachlamydia sp.]|jgi:hypothetical protein|nr:hypothetical protein [Parachlamydia sp.]